MPQAIIPHLLHLCWQLSEQSSDGSLCALPLYPLLQAASRQTTPQHEFCKLSSPTRLEIVCTAAEKSLLYNQSGECCQHRGVIWVSWHLTILCVLPLEKAKAWRPAKGPLHTAHGQSVDSWTVRGAAKQLQEDVSKTDIGGRSPQSCRRASST